MSNKLQELTDKLYQEGLSKGKQEGDRYLEEAREKAAKIVSEAEAEAEAIVAGARKQAEDLRSKAEADVRMASQQCLQATRKDIENVLIGKLSASDQPEKFKRNNKQRDPGVKYRSRFYFQVKKRYFSVPL